ncbi:MAG TPA: cob(I)yrinic acid a,c-diamide adenosyltransferase [Herpetosiphonaceae bacterium]|nr:cob(I)yrinic acid a,c-diamide adenosyltransferase [Herpetosiphonaceae bacterium]
MSDAAPTTRAYGRHLFICTHGDCAPSEAGEALAAAVPPLLGDHRKLRNPERIKCTISDCLGVCSGGPVVVVYPDGIWYHHVDEALLARIVQEHLIEGRPVEEAIFHRLYPPGEEPGYAPAARGDAGSYTSAVPVPSLIPSSDTQLHSTDAKKARRADVRQRRIKKGLVIVNTGNGKGKTSAALGVMTRAWGRGMKVRVVQFLKHENARFGETRAAEKMGVAFGGTGDGFTWTSTSLDETAAKALHGWELAKQIIAANEHDLVILDEFTYLMAFGWLPAGDVVAWLQANKPEMMHVIITGRDAPQELIDYADLVTEMREIKHPFKDQGIRAQPGIEF